jgi:hypothetical protein
MPATQEELAASIEALTANPGLRLPGAGQRADKLPAPDGLPPASSSPANLPAGFGLLGRRRQAKKDEK